MNLETELTKCENCINMKINNSKDVTGLRIRFFIYTVILIAWIILVYFAKVIKFPLLWLDERSWTLILLGIYLALSIYPLLLTYQFIVYSDESDKIIFRYSYAGIIGGRKNSVEIPKEEYAGYKYEKSMLGLRKRVILFRQYKGGIAKYPPVYISILGKNDRAKLLNSLFRHAPADAMEAGK